MHEIEPGHRYRYQVYPALEEQGPVYSTDRDEVTFRKRIGDGYPGNVGHRYAGTSTQELLRVVVARSKYVDGQEQHVANRHLIGRARMSLYDLESRTARRRGEAYLNRWNAELLVWYVGQTHVNLRAVPLTSSFADVPIEELEPCPVCAHVLCWRYE